MGILGEDGFDGGAMRNVGGGREGAIVGLTSGSGSMGGAKMGSSKEGRDGSEGAVVE